MEVCSLQYWLLLDAGPLNLFWPPNNRLHPLFVFDGLPFAQYEAVRMQPLF
jgi:hypothetical protein